MTPTDDAGFFSRWSRRKASARGGRPPDEAPAGQAPGPASADAPKAATVDVPPSVAPPRAVAAPAPLPVTPASSGQAPVAFPSAPAEAPPTLEEVAELTPQSDFRRFVARDVDAGVRNAALKKLFADPHFNVMDGLDTYIDDYGRPDPLPADMLRRLAQSRFLGLLNDDEPADAGPRDAERPAAPALDEPTASDEDADLQLQPDDAARREGAGPGADEDAGRQP